MTKRRKPKTIKPASKIKWLMFYGKKTTMDPTLSAAYTEQPDPPTPIEQTEPLAKDERTYVLVFHCLDCDFTSHSMTIAQDHILTTDPAHMLDSRMVSAEEMNEVPAT